MEIKLIGAETFVCVPAGIHEPIHAGDTVVVKDDHAAILLTRTYSVKDQEYPLFSSNLKAAVKTKSTVSMPLEERKRREALDAESAKELAVEKKRADDAELRIAKMEEQIDALMAAGPKQGDTNSKEPKKTPARKRKAKKAASAASASA